MPFLRPGQVVAFASPNPKFLQFGLLTLFSVSAATSASARSSKPVGVKAWTSGSKTYIRARPGATVPPVAKVPRHTPLFVWGKYNGWYRVETHDHIFGWVFNDYINAPGLDKVPSISRNNAKIASNRTGNQTMFGTPQALKKHYAMYGATGAIKGLKLQGVYLATAPKATKPKTAIAKTPKTVAPRVASAPRIREKVAIAPPAPRAFIPRQAASHTVDASPVPSVETLTPVNNVAPLGNAAESASAPREVATQKITGAISGMSPSARMFARAASAQTSAESPATASSAPVAVAPIAPVISRPVAATPRVVAKPVARPAAKKTVAKKPVAKKPVAKSTRASRYAATRERKRQQLRVKMGLSPNSKPPTVIAPVSPLELMKAREDYLNSRKARLGSSEPVASPAVIAPVPAPPTIGVAPLPAPSGPLGGPTEGSLAPAPPANIQPMSLEVRPGTHPLDAIINNEQILAMAQLKPRPKARVVCAPVKAKSPIAARGGAIRGGSPRDRAAAVRGGSPRDRIASGMATQALSYRGMPYIRGAASPRRGFDCSGLVYFLLRQRGYNPPRTAAGYRNWGASVPRGQWKSGDLVLFANTYKRGISHIGVYLGEGKFVHAATSGTGVRVSSLNEAYYARKYFGARRIK